MGLCGCFTSSRSRNADPESKQTADDEDYAGQLARLMSCQLEGEPVVTVRQLSNARVNVSAVESSEPQKEFMPHTARLRSMDFSAHAQEVREQMDWTASRWDLDSALKSEQEAAGKRAVWETGLLLAEDTLRARLRKLSLDLHIMEGDGNCQFRSVAHSVYGSQEQHMRVRRAAIMHMRRCPDEFRAFLGSDFDAYLASMSESGVWGDELTLRAISNALCITISVVIGATQMVRYIPTDYRQGKTVRRMWVGRTDAWTGNRAGLVWVGVAAPSSCAEARMQGHELTASNS
uniref:OTU domain-containing protein n=1 Tax=Auxenochlorella protothecoides TaxID=3075 RepID=A0A1D1ZRD3_AUXPR